MTRDDPFEYDIALSFAGEDKEVAEELAALLTKKDIRVFYDEYKAGAPWGRDLVDHLVNIFSRKARYCVMLISGHYPLRRWTDTERKAAQERALRDANEYILPIRLDDTDVPGAAEATGYRDLREHSLESIADLLEQKLAQARGEAGPPSQSHDLRSGNVPSK
jgi:hypothetical protein